MSKLKVFFLMLLSVTLAYFGSLKYGFSQDDWYFLSISTAHNLRDIFNFFNPWSQSGFAFYRPLGTQLYYYLARQTLGLEGAPLGMHLFMLLLHSMSAYSVYRLVSKLSRNFHLSLMAGLIYATSATHFLSLYYLAATQQLLAALFSLLSINDFLDRHRFRSAAWFALALLSKELAIMTPLIMLLAQLKLSNHLNLKKLLPRLYPLGLVAVLYLSLRLFGGLQIQSEYGLVLNLSVFSTIRWYYLFSFGAPEELVRYGLPRLAIDFARYLKDYGWQGLVTSAAPILLGITVLFRAVKRPRPALIYFAWWILALLPVIFLADHRYPHYLDLALVPLILLLLEGRSRRVQIALTTLIISISLVSLNLSEFSHWTTSRSLLSSSAVKFIKTHHACRFDTWYIEGAGDSPTQLSYALSLGNAANVICNRVIQVYYQKVGEDTAPSDSLHISAQEIIDL